MINSPDEIVGPGESESQAKLTQKRQGTLTSIKRKRSDPEKTEISRFESGNELE